MSRDRLVTRLTEVATVLGIGCLLTFGVMPSEGPNPGYMLVGGTLFLASMAAWLAALIVWLWHRRE